MWSSKNQADFQVLCEKFHSNPKQVPRGDDVDLMKHLEEICARPYVDLMRTLYTAVEKKNPELKH